MSNYHVKLNTAPYVNLDTTTEGKENQRFMYTEKLKKKKWKAKRA